VTKGEKDLDGKQRNPAEQISFSLWAKPLIRSPSGIPPLGTKTHPVPVKVRTPCPGSRAHSSTPVRAPCSCRTGPFTLMRLSR